MVGARPHPISPSPGIDRVDHCLVGATLMAAGKPEQDRDKIFPSFQLDIVFAGSVTEEIEHLLLGAAHDPANGADEWSDKIDDITREIQHAYLIHRNETVRQRTTRGRLWLGYRPPACWPRQFMPPKG